MVWMFCRRGQWSDSSSAVPGGKVSSVTLNVAPKLRPRLSAFDFSMVKIDEPFGNCQAEPESAELPADRTISLLEGPKQGKQSLRFNSDSCVGNFEMKTGLLHH